MSARLTLAGPLLVAMVAHAAAAPVAETNALNRKVPLDCQLQQSKIVVITNSTKDTISAGTHISFDTLRRGSAAHFDGSFASGTMPPGAVVHRPAVDSLSCTAWYTTRPVMKLP